MASRRKAENNEMDRSSEATVTSSPQRPPRRSASTREKRNPTITPRKFTRFFTPRSQPLHQRQPTRRVLFNVRSFGASSALNVQSSPLQSKGFDEENNPPDLPRQSKRQKRFHTLASSTQPSVMSTKNLGLDRIQQSQSKGESKDDVVPSSPCPQGSHLAFEHDGTLDEDEDEDRDQVVCPGRISSKDTATPVLRWNRNGGLSAQLFEMELGNAGRSGRVHHSYPVNDWRDSTANFCSKPEDVHDIMSLGEEPRRTIPFVALGLNNSSLLAVGDEEGRVRLLESAKGGKPSFQKNFLGFRVHTNAIIDMTFSDDDSLLATASGDQSARVVDMGTQTTIAILGIHTASLKQVRFQPGANNKNVLATSGRDGSIQIWDLRCKGHSGPQCKMWTPVIERRTGARSRAVDQDILYPRPLNSITDSHRPLPGRSQPSTAGWTDLASRGEAASRSESLSRSADVSVTALQFLHEGLHHLLLSACEADASVKLWDIRTVSSKQRTLPISGTALPPWHVNYRDFGITALNLSSNGSRIYAVCKDNIVYTYRTSHLMLGHAPELEIQSNTRPSQAKLTQEGLGPIYGLRNPKFHANTFYVKSALRTTNNGHSELLAVGSSDDCAVLFPTDERYLPSPHSARGAIPVKQEEFDCRAMPTCPIYTIGSSLTRGHDREVGCVTWTHDGELVTVGDDLIVRCWREDRDSAKDLRTGGESEGRRWNCGWATVEADYDDDDEC
ncbi:WD40 repeat-like protein [Mollisia scopiformis]|uniref:WD40 repeat-like protein n=1 Tax=Mollisia scopiformis TaxID=149040 RepID=A0A194XPW5_MOLSC|nr:WD40 repeat-like protein [Mollisia scopiformis]KUJ22201.1 WD40 repeat-like protein [Mollisia scopiformis]